MVGSLAVITIKLAKNIYLIFFDLLLSCCINCHIYTQYLITVHAMPCHTWSPLLKDRQNARSRIANGSLFVEWLCSGTPADNRCSTGLWGEAILWLFKYNSQTNWSSAAQAICRPNGRQADQRMRDTTTSLCCTWTDSQHIHAHREPRYTVKSASGRGWTNVLMVEYLVGL